jgi:predicted TIM-barrel fold metal-dependent hydrolase
VHYANTYGREKVMFGTDWPVIHPERAMAEVEGLGLDPVAKRMLLRDNALRVFKLPGYRPLRKRANIAATRRS